MEKIKAINWSSIEDTHTEAKESVFKKTLDNIVAIAKDIAKADVGVLFLTADRIFLEAAHYSPESTQKSNPPPASELPTYRLKWESLGEVKAKELDGLTAYVAVNREFVNLSAREVFDHPAHKGKWDEVFLGGESTKCKGILAIPIQENVKRKKDSKPSEDQVYGVLKVENPTTAKDSVGRFASHERDALIEYAEIIAKNLKDNPNFWKEFVADRENLKVSYINELLERGDPISKNLSRSLTYVNIFFKTFLECEYAAHIFWCSGERDQVHILHLPKFENNCDFKDYKTIDEINKESLLQRTNSYVEDECTKKMIDRINSNMHAEIVQSGSPRSVELYNLIYDLFSPESKLDDCTKKMISWINSNMHAEIVQSGRPINVALYNLLFPKLKSNAQETPDHPTVDIIRLKANKFDLGAIILPKSSLLWEQKENSKVDETEIQDKLEQDKLWDRLTRLAINVASIIGRFIQDEYETKENTYLPLHRLPQSDKTCAILFADIRNFSTLVQILRMSGKTEELGHLMNSFSEEMGKIIGKSCIGRVDKFMGDGVMALYGEDFKDKYNDVKVIIAVYNALKMRDKFNEVYKNWWDGHMAKKNLFDFRRTFNEDVEVGLTVGVNIGEVYLDYFGDDSHREYTAIGDHVNFTQRIRDFAGEYDENLKRRTSDILLSQTAYQYLFNNGYLKEKKEPIWLRLKGLGVPYPIFELFESDLDYDNLLRKLDEINMANLVIEREKSISN